MTQPAILINLKRCTGCWTCSMACRVGNNVAEDEWWQHVRTIGSGSGIDEPSGVWPNVHMSWMPIHSSDCTLCGARTAQGQEPYCSYNCPTKAMTYGDLDDPASPISVRMRELKEKGFQIYTLPVWEHTRPEIVYARKG